MPVRLVENLERQPAFDRAIMAISQTARRELATKFATRPYHNLLHANSVDRRSNSLLLLMNSALPQQINSREMGLAHIIALAHDIIQPDELGTRRDTTPEKLSVGWLFAKMDEQTDQQGVPIFTQEDKLVVEEAIIATTPLFLGGGIIRQPFLRNATSPITVAIALADLYGSGIDGAQSQINDTKNLFLELHGDTVAKNSDAENKTVLDSWLKTQLEFVEDRRETLSHDLDAISEDVLPKAARELIIARCAGNFTASFEATERLITESSGLNFTQTMSLFTNWGKN